MQHLQFTKPICGLTVLLVGLALAGCDSDPRTADMTPAPMGPEPAAVTEVSPEQYNRNLTQAEDAQALMVNVVSAEDPSKVLGSATLVQETDQVVVQFDIAANDVIPPGKRAIHIHEHGDCGAVDGDLDGSTEPAAAAGGHFNPTNVGHGDDGPHAGDSEEYNYTFNDDGSFRGEVVFTDVTLSGEHALQNETGTAIVIHAGTDDKESNPSGDSGPRVACAAIPADNNNAVAWDE